MDKQEDVEETSKLHCIWIGEEDRIASFHEVDTYMLQTFICHDTYIKFLRDLEKRGFRFQ